MTSALFANKNSLFIYLKSEPAIVPNWIQLNHRLAAFSGAVHHIIYNSSEQRLLSTDS